MAVEEKAAPGTATTPKPRRWILMFIGLAGACAGLTLLFLGMRSVMEIGGSCVSGNTPYANARQCPTGVPGMMLLGIFGGLISLGVYAFNAIGVNLAVFAWPALFISLGWNFLVYGIDPPVGGSPSWGWLICAVIFIAMGVGPLVIGISAWRSGRTAKWRAVAKTREIGVTLSSVDVDRAQHLARVGIAVQIVAIVVGIWVGIELFEWATGTSVGFGFR